MFSDLVRTFESNGDGENRTLLVDTNPESDRLAAAAAAAEEDEGKAKSVESPVSSNRLNMIRFCKPVIRLTG